MSSTIKRSAVVEVRIEAVSLPEAKVIEFYSDAENQQRWQQSLTGLCVQMHSYITDSEDEGALQRSRLSNNFDAMK